jgi:hypothetical protein
MNEPIAAPSQLQNVSRKQVVSVLILTLFWLVFCVWLNITSIAEKKIADARQLALLVRDSESLNYGLCGNEPSPMVDIDTTLQQGRPITMGVYQKAKAKVDACQAINREVDENRRQAKIQQDAIMALRMTPDKVASEP